MTMELLTGAVVVATAVYLVVALVRPEWLR
jgi:K+-transporting ATPase KdpF subunit